MFLLLNPPVQTSAFPAGLLHPRSMLTGVRMKPVAIIAALVVMIVALLYVALNRSHEVEPAPPLHQAR